MQGGEFFQNGLSNASELLPLIHKSKWCKMVCNMEKSQPHNAELDRL